MRDFYFEQSYANFLASDRKAIKNTSFILVGLFCIYSAFHFFGVGRNADYLNQVLFFSVILIILYNCYSKEATASYSDKDKWVISLSGFSLSWSSPPQMIEKSNEVSFEVDIMQIEEIQKSFNDDGSPYMFILKNGTKIKPGINSSIDMNELIEIIKERGVQFNRVSNFSS